MKIKTEFFAERNENNSFFRIYFNSTILDWLFVPLGNVDCGFLARICGRLSTGDCGSRCSFDLDLEHFQRRPDRQSVEDVDVGSAPHAVEPNVLERLLDFRQIDHDVSPRDDPMSIPRSNKFDEKKLPERNFHHRRLRRHRVLDENVPVVFPRV